jgi:hypothetical protein
MFSAEHGIMVVAKYSRLACDVERFRDDNQEPCAIIGNGFFSPALSEGLNLGSQMAS